MEYFDVIQKRFSVRSFKDQPVEQEKLDKILDAARLAPTAKNLQAFKIVVIKTEGRVEELKRIYPREFFVQAPVILGIFVMPEKSWVRPDGWNYRDVDASIVFDHVILAATDLGLGTCWIGAFDAQAAREVIGLGAGYEPVAFTPLGYTEKTEPKKVRKDIDDIAVYL